MQEQARKRFYKKHLSKSKRRLQVSGQKDLAESGVYTPQFCRAVLKMWEACEMEFSLTMGSGFLTPMQLWKVVFSGSATMEETCQA